jgi:hypothetical protein
MKCRACGHSLWNQPAPADGGPRACSECGAPYRPDDFDFVPGSVRFACWGCGAAYFGTDARGHLEPAVFDCAECGRALSMDRCVVSPDGPWSSDADDGRYMRLAELPWFGDGPFLRRWWSTIRVAFARPGEIPFALQREPRLLRAWLFLAVQSWIVAFAGGVSGLVLFGVASGMGGGRFAGLGAPMAAGAVAVVLVQFLLAPVLAMLGMLVTACFVRPAIGPGVPLPRLVEISCYASGGMLLGVLPVCGGSVGWIVWLVHTAIAYARTAPRDRVAPVVILAVVGAFASGCIGLGSGMMLQLFVGL